jgi:hypothetical protein
LSRFLAALVAVVGTAIAVERQIEWLGSRLPGQKLQVTVKDGLYSVTAHQGADRPRAAGGR